MAPGLSFCEASTRHSSTSTSRMKREDRRRQRSHRDRRKSRLRISPSRTRFQASANCMLARERQPELACRVCAVPSDALTSDVSASSEATIVPCLEIRCRDKFRARPAYNAREPCDLYSDAPSAVSTAASDSHSNQWRFTLNATLLPVAHANDARDGENRGLGDAAPTSAITTMSAMSMIERLSQL